MQFLGFCHLPIKLDPLNPKMAFLFGFGAPGRRRRHLQITKLGLGKASLIGKWQNMKIDYFENATLKLPDGTTGTTSYTLHLPWYEYSFYLRAKQVYKWHLVSGEQSHGLTNKDTLKLGHIANCGHQFLLQTQFWPPRLFRGCSGLRGC